MEKNCYRREGEGRGGGLEGRSDGIVFPGGMHSRDLIEKREKGEGAGMKNGIAELKKGEICIFVFYFQSSLYNGFMNIIMSVKNDKD